VPARDAFAAADPVGTRLRTSPPCWLAEHPAQKSLRNIIIFFVLNNTFEMKMNLMNYLVNS
jgi:hypothetical protein